MRYPFDKKGWKVYDLETSEYLVSRDVVFVETNFSYSATMFAGENSTKNADRAHEHKDSEIIEEDGEILEKSPEGYPPTEKIAEISAAENREENSGEEVLVGDQLGHGHRIKQSSTRLKDYVTNNVQFSPSQSSPFQPHSSGVSYAIANFVGYDQFSSQHWSFLASITAGSEPVSYNEAMRDE